MLYSNPLQLHKNHTYAKHTQWHLNISVTLASKCACLPLLSFEIYADTDVTMPFVFEVKEHET